MRLIELPLQGAFVVDPEPIEDERGFFARTFCASSFEKLGLDPRVSQCNVSFNRQRGTVRGMHFQRPPHPEAKLVRCTAGAIWDVIVDLRDGSPTRGRWHAKELTAANHGALFIPAGFAHGFQTLTDDAEVFYQMSTAYEPAASGGINPFDPALGIAWPLPVSAVSDRDRGLPALSR